MKIDNLIGSVAGELVLETLQQQASTEPLLMLTAFSAPEVLEMLDKLAGQVLPGRSEPIHVVVAAPSVDAEFMSSADVHHSLLGPDETLTHVRNRLKPGGTVMVAIGDQSDAEGLKQIFRFGDEDVLAADGVLSFERRFRSIIDRSWTNATSGRIQPEALYDKLLELFRSFSDAHGGPPALRPWCRYLDAVVDEVAARSATVTDSDVQTSIGANLVALGLFPDAAVLQEPTPAAIARRVDQNVRLSAFCRPNGKLLVDSELINLIDSVSLVDDVGSQLAPDRLAGHQADMRALVDGNEEARANIPFRIWSQLFTKQSTGGVGRQVRQHLGQHSPQRVQEYDDLDVTDGLNDRDRSAAQQLIDHVGPPDADTSLYGLLSSSLRRAVDRMAAATESVRDPLVAILRRVTHADLDDVKHVKLSPAQEGEEGQFSRALFGLFYGPTLASLAVRTADGTRARLQVDSSLLDVGPLRLTRDDHGEEEAEVSRSTTGWEPLSLRLHFDDDLVATLLWNPEQFALISFGRLLSEKNESGPISVKSLEELELIAADPTSDMPAAQPSRTSDFGFQAQRTQFLDEVRSTGLSAEAIHRFCDAYLAALQAAHGELVPAGAPLAELDEFLDIDTAQLEGSATAVLAIHPLRLRWLARHLEELASAISSALDGDLALNDENEQLYFDWLARVSPHRQPPFLSPKSGQFSISTREYGFHEEFAALRPSGAGKNEWGGSVDSDSVDLIAQVALKYLDEFPHTVDGLSVLLLDPVGEVHLAVGLIQQIRKSSEPDLVLHLHVAAPKERHSAIAAAVSQLDEDSDRSVSLLPRLQLMLHDLSADRSMADLKSLEDAIDICVAPDLFGAGVVVNTHASGPQAASGAFDPWLDDPVRTVDSLQPGIAVVRHLLPAAPDPLLDHWSSANVRRKTNTPVGGVDDLDYLSMTVQFFEHLELFEKLHDVGHWVVTLDRFVGRQQFDAAANRPDIIQVIEGVGKTDAYTLIVSSSSGRRFIADRFSRRLLKNFGLFSETESADAAANRLYDVGRNLVPGIMLRALGLGRTAEEVLGLVVARWRLSETHPTASGSTELWLSLDDFTQWFGGFHKSRADILRLSVEHSDDGWDEMTIDVIESKFRQTDDIGTAIEQVNATIRLLEAAFNEPDHDDHRFWLRELASAVSQTAASSAPPEDLPAYRQGVGGPTKRDLVFAIQRGKVRLRALRGFVCSTNSTGEGDDEATDLPDGIVLLRSRRPGLVRVLNHLIARDSPTTDSANVSTSDSDPQVDASPSADIPTDYPTGATLSPEHSAELPAPAPGAEPMSNGQAAEQAEQSVAESSAQLGMSAEELDAVYQVALNVFSAHKVDVDRPERLSLHEQGPGFFLLRFNPGTGTTSGALTARALDLKLRLELDRDQEIRSYVDRGAVVFEIPKAPHQRYGVDAGSLWNRATWPSGHLFAPLGEDIGGEVIGIDFSSSTTPHLLIAGTTGSGKSVALETILRGVCRDKKPGQLRLHLVDPKGTELVDFEGSDHLEGQIGFDADDAVAFLDILVGEMQTRYQTFKDARVRSLQEYNEKIGSTNEAALPWRLLVLDEYADLTGVPTDRRAIEGRLQRLAQKGRAAGLHVIVATQRPSADVITTVVRSNLPAQLALRVRDATDSRIVIGEAGAEALSGQGDALLRTDSGVVRIQCGMA